MLFPVSHEQLTVKAGWILAGPEGGSRAYNPARGESNMMVSLKDEVEITHDFQMKGRPVGIGQSNAAKW